MLPNDSSGNILKDQIEIKIENERLKKVEFKEVKLL